MLTLIVIGKNEGWKLTKCLESIFNFVNVNLINDYEVIYVDSKSTDDSLDRAKAFTGIKVFLITGDCNAAVARNIGAKESKGDILFFIDGDMEIQSDFYKSVFTQYKKLIYPFVSGGLINLNYDSYWNSLSETKYSRNVNEDKFEHTTGGIFLIERTLWDLVGGMKTQFKVNEDVDFGLRLSKVGYPILRKSEIIAHHHTIPYNNSQRIWKQLFNGSDFYPMVLFRYHSFYFPAIKIFIFQNYTMLFLIISLLLSFVIQSNYILILYFILVFLKSYKTNKKLNFSMLINSIKLVLRDITRFFAVFLFWPRNMSIKYRKINEW